MLSIFERTAINLSVDWESSVIEHGDIGLDLSIQHTRENLSESGGSSATDLLLDQRPVNQTLVKHPGLNAR